MSAKQVRNMPVKICYLKDDHKKQQPVKQDKLSIPYLSSALQSQKKSSNKDLPYLKYLPNQQIDDRQNGQKMFYQNTHNFDELLIYTTPLHTTTRQYAKTTQPLKSYSQWNRTKSKSHKDDQRMLTNILGNNWPSAIPKDDEQKIFKRFNTKLKTHKTITKKTKSYQQQKLKNNNDRMLHEHFKIFLKNQHQSNLPQKQPQQQPKSFINKVDDRLEVIKNNKHTKNTKYLNKSLIETSGANPRSWSIENQQFMNIKQKNTGSNLRVIFSSEAARTGFTHIPNFQWSKLNQNNGFKL